MTKQQMKVIAQAEHEMFCLRDLLEGSVPAKVMNRAYEYVIKQDLLSVLRETPLTHQQLSVLAPQRRPLDFLYRLWLKTEYSHIDALRRAVRRETRRKMCIRDSWNAAHQLYFAVGGNGARAGGRGTKVFCINIYTGAVPYTHLDVYKRQPYDYARPFPVSVLGRAARRSHARAPALRKYRRTVPR